MWEVTKSHNGGAEKDRVENVVGDGTGKNIKANELNEGSVTLVVDLARDGEVGILRI